MEDVVISHLHSHEGCGVQLKGWVYNVRSSGKIGFLLLRDGSGICQCIVRTEFSKKNYQKLLECFKSLKQEDCVIVEGMVKKHKSDYEIHVQSLKKWSSELENKTKHSSFSYPLGKKDHGIDFLLNNRHLWLRSKKPWAVLRIRHELMQAIHTFFFEREFIQVSAPVLTPTACEGSADLFSVDFFGEKNTVFLSQSGQLYMEAAAAGFGKVYCLSPVFRAEKSSTRRHLMEFWMVEPEMAFYDLDQCMDEAQKLVEYLVKRVLKNRKQELMILQRDITLLEKIKAPFPRLSYPEAIQLLDSKKDYAKGLGGEDETLLSSQFEKPVFIHRYPLEAKAFYMKTDPKNPQCSLSFDLLGTQGYGELIGGSQREDNLQNLEQKIKAHHLESKHFQWYTDLRKYGSFPHSGFGLGVERLVSWICGLNHVRESIAFPRMYGRNFF